MGFTDYVGEIYETLVNTPRNELKLTKENLQASVPEPMCSALDKQSNSEAIQKYTERKAKETVLCPPTCTGTVVHVVILIHMHNIITNIETIKMILGEEIEAMLQREQEQQQGVRRPVQGRKAPTCTKCGAPRKGHKRGQCEN